MAYVGLKYDLVRHGLDKGYVFRTFADSRNNFLPDVVRKIAFLRKEAPDIYQKFLRPEVVAQGRAYLSAHRAELARPKPDTAWPRRSSSPSSRWSAAWGATPASTRSSTSSPPWR